MINTGILFALGTTLSWAICIFPFTQAARRLGNNALNHFRLLLAAFLIGTVAFLVERNSFISLFTNSFSASWMWLGISGIIGLTIGDYFAFVMYSILGARIGSVLNTFAPAAALILGALIIDERISAIGVTGILITIGGVNFLSFGKTEREKIPDHGHGSVFRGIIAGILAALCQGAGLVLAKKGMIVQGNINELLPLNAAFIRLSIAAVSLSLFSMLTGNFKKLLRPVIENKNGGVKYALAGTLFGPILGVLFSLYSVKNIDPSVAQTIFSLVPAFALIMSAFIFKEKISAKSVIGLFIAIAGVIILVWREQISILFER